MYKKSKHLPVLFASAVISCSLLGCGLPDEIAERKLAIFTDTTTRPPTFPPAEEAHSGLSVANGNEVNNPTYSATTITNETIGVSGTDTKTKVFQVHPITAAVGFTIRLTTTQQNNATVILMAPDGRTTPCFYNGTDCIAPLGAEQITMSVRGQGTGAWYATYSTTYFQNCDNAAGRTCIYTTHFDDKSIKFNGTTEALNGDWQGYVRLFCLSGVDAATLRFTSNKAMATTPSLRPVATDPSGTEVLLGPKFNCNYTGRANNGTEWQYECAIPAGAGPSIPAGYTNPYLRLSSARTSSRATLRMWNATRTNTSPCP